MSLFTDSHITSVDSMMQIDGEVASVAGANKPPLDVDGVIALAWSECATELQSAMQLYGTLSGSSGMSNHQAAIDNIGGPARNVPRIRLNQVITHDCNYAGSISALQNWVTYRALYLFYRNASSRVSSGASRDRYEQKADKFQAYGDGPAFRMLKETGLPCVFTPLEAPGALHAFSAGLWSASNVSAAVGGANALAQPVNVAITYYDANHYASPTLKGNAESGPSAVIPFSIPANQLLSVNILSLSPPNGQMENVGTTGGLYTPLNATHWNLYVGTKWPYLFLQASIPIATKTWTLAADPVYSGPTLQQGQFPSAAITFQRLQMRA